MNTHRIIQAIDHTNLDPCATEEEILAFAAAAQGTGIASLCVQPCYVATLAQHFPGGVPICTVVGFPPGLRASGGQGCGSAPGLCRWCQRGGYGAPLGRIKAGDYSAVQRDVAAVLAERPAGGKIKVILETGALTDEEIFGTVQALNDLDIDFTNQHRLWLSWRQCSRCRADHAGQRPEIQLKASGGIRTIEDAEAYLRLGATRIGASKLLAACLAAQE